MPSPELTPHERQLALEMEQLDRVVSDYRSLQREVIALGRGSQLPGAKRLVVEWFHPLSAAIREELDLCATAIPGTDRLLYGPYLMGSLVPPDKLAVIAIHHTLNEALVGGGMAKWTRVVTQIGEAVERERGMAQLRNVDRLEWTRLQSAMRGTGKAAKLPTGPPPAGSPPGAAPGGGHGQISTHSILNRIRRTLGTPEWGTAVHVKVGSVLLALLMQTARVSVRPDGTPTVMSADERKTLLAMSAAESETAAMPPAPPAKELGVGGVSSGTAGSSVGGGVGGSSSAPAAPSAPLSATAPAAAAARGLIFNGSNRGSTVLSVPDALQPSLESLNRIRVERQAACELGIRTLVTEEPYLRSAFGLHPPDLEALVRQTMAEAEAAGKGAGAGAATRAASSPSPPVSTAPAGKDAAWHQVGRAPATAKVGAQSPQSVGGKQQEQQQSQPQTPTTVPPGFKGWLTSSSRPMADAPVEPGGKPLLSVPAFSHGYIRGRGAKGGEMIEPDGILLIAPAELAQGRRVIEAKRAAEAHAAACEVAAREGRPPPPPPPRSVEAVRGAEPDDLGIVKPYQRAPPTHHTAGVLILHPYVQAMLSGSASSFAPPTALPMLVPPVKWASPLSGGYLSPRNRTCVVRVPPGHRGQLEAIREATARRTMDPVYRCLDVLGATPWVVNGPLLDVAWAAWRGGGGVGDMPPSTDVEVPPEPDRAYLASLPLESRNKEYRSWFVRHRAALVANANLHSMRCDFKLKMDVASRFVGERELFFPFNMDFRGRVYPVPPHLNHMGNDLCRSTLLFRDAKPLGPGGLRWLKIHAANLMGVDKAPFEDRAAFIDDHMADVLDSAARPLTGNGWWRGADAPWQALAALQELAAAHSGGPGSRPEAYSCRLPIQLDGSCNGLQHYAALGRDAAGGAAVNLVPIPGSDRPADVYSHVLRLVLARLESDSALPLPTPDEVGAVIGAPGGDRDVMGTLLTWGHSAASAGTLPSPAPHSSSSAAAPLPALRPMEDEGADDDGLVGKAWPKGSSVVDTPAFRSLAARFLAGRVDRKVIKQTVMTSVYGVTFIGARDQILARLKDKCADSPPTPAIPADELEPLLFMLSSYLARMTLSSLGDLFASADAIKAWLSSTSRLVAMSTGQPMAWVTPLGLPVVQPYRRDGISTVSTCVQDVVIAESSESLPVAAQRQRSAFPPNYVHSLDSTHMMMTALDMSDRGLAFTAVHDSYWSHAADTDTMAACLREQFISLYSQPLLERLRDSLAARFPTLDLPELPARGSLNLEDVRHSRYFFS